MAASFAATLSRSRAVAPLAAAAAAASLLRPRAQLMRVGTACAAACSLALTRLSVPRPLHALQIADPAPDAAIERGLEPARAAPLLEALLLMVGKRTHRGKNKRPVKPANHGARPCNSRGRKARRPRGMRYRG